MLDTTLATDFIPGTNLKDAVAGANWLFLLPSLEVARIVSVGVPPLSTLSTLSKLAQSVTVLCSSATELRYLSSLVDKSNLQRITSNRINDCTSLVFEEQSIDVLLIVPGIGAKSLLLSDSLCTQLRNGLSSQGVTFVDLGCPHSSAPSVSTLSGKLAQFGFPSLYWMTPIACREMQGAVPLTYSTVIDYFCEKNLYGAHFRSRPLRTVEGFLARQPAFNRMFRRCGAMIVSSGSQATGQPPQYLKGIAENCGVCIDDLEWGLSAMGNYNSRKVLFFLFDRSTTMPRFVAKITRTPELNYRLENEYKALKLLNRLTIPPESIPQPAFFGHHAGLAILGQSAVDGVPFRDATTRSPNCQLIRAAVDWLITLGALTQDPDASTPADIAHVLRILFRRFVAIYRLTPEQHTYLTDQIGSLEDLPYRIPLVFQHGDPGTWNVLVTHSRRVAFLDWEAAEPRGMPLWDLFYFLRSCIATATRSRRARRFLAPFLQNMHHDSRFGSLMHDSTKRYCETLQIPFEIVRPLFLTCWMHRALKEATRLTPARLEDGHYVNLLRHYIQHPNHTFPASCPPVSVWPCPAITNS